MTHTPTGERTLVMYAQVGNGRTSHYTRSHGPRAATLCKRTVSRILTPAQANRLTHHCVKCTAAADHLAAIPATAEARTPARTEERPTAEAPRRYLATYEATPNGPTLITVTRDGDNTPTFTRELPHDPQRNAGRTLDALGWTITGMDTYGGPSLFHAWVQPGTPTTAAEPAPIDVPTNRAPANVKALRENVTTPATMFDEALTYYADGTAVAVRWDGGELVGVTAGMTTDRGPYQYQVVRYADGTTANVAPHVVHPTVEATPEHAPPLAVQEVTHPAAPVIDRDEAARIMSGLWPAARDFEPRHDTARRLTGYTFAVPGPSTRYGWITAAGAYAWGLEPYRTDAEDMLTAMVAEEDRKAQRPSLAEQHAASVAAYRTKEAARTVAYRAEMDDRTATMARVHGVAVPDGVAARIAARAEEPAPFAAGDLVTCADGVVRTALGMAPAVPGEPAHYDLGQDPAVRVLEGVIVEHAGTSQGSAPKHAGHPDVIAARAALVDVAPATCTDHDALDGSDPSVRGFLIEPRGAGEVNVFWIEAGRAVRRDEAFHGASLDCLEWSMNHAGWSTEPLRPSATCVTAHAPTGTPAPLPQI